MNTSTFTRLILTSVLGTTLFVQGQNTLISGDIATGTNWDTGSPTTVGNVGIIDSDNTGGNAGVLTGATGLFIQQTGGELSGTSFGWKDFTNVDYDLSGGTFSVTTFGLRMLSGSSLTISGSGNFSSTNALNVRDASSIVMTGGSLTASTAIRATNGSSFDFSGGTVNVGTMFDQSANTSEVDFSGTVAFTSTNFGNGTGIQNINIGSGTGSLSTTNLNSSTLNIDWASGSGFSFTATNIDSGSTWEDLWNAGDLTVDGGQSGTFASNFNDVGGTLTLVTIPEPSTFMLVGVAGLALLAARRRR